MNANLEAKLRKLSDQANLCVEPMGIRTSHPDMRCRALAKAVQSLNSLVNDIWEDTERGLQFDEATKYKSTLRDLATALGVEDKT